MPGIFLDYYIGPDGKFSGQYVVAELDDFVEKALHHRVGPHELRLHLHRSEVVRDPVGPTDPVFPLKRRYMKLSLIHI